MADALERTRYPGIFRRGSRYVVPYRRRGKQHRPAFRTLSDARGFKARLTGEGTRAPATRLTVADYADDWLPTFQGRTSRGFTERSRKAYRASLDRHALPYFGRWKMSEIERGDVRAFVSHLQSQNLAPASVKRTLVPLAAMFATAVDDGHLKHNPFERVRINFRREDEAGEDEQAKALTMAQVEMFMGHVPEGHRLFFRLLADTGLRVSEAIGLNVEDVAFGAPTVLRVRRQVYRGHTSKLKSRNGKRDLPLPSDLARGLWARCHGADPEEPLFTSREGTRLSDGNMRRRVLNPAAKAAGVPWIGFHTFRHTCASRLLAGGKNIAQVARWLGHADPAFTLRTYVHLMDEGLGDAEFMVRAGGETATSAGSPAMIG